MNSLQSLAANLGRRQAERAMLNILIDKVFRLPYIFSGQMTSSQMKQYVTALKMFFVLGVTWIVEVINYVLGWKYDHCWDSLSTLTVVSDLSSYFNEIF